MSDRWYSAIGPDTPLDQGDIIAGFPVLGWAEELPEDLGQRPYDPESLGEFAAGFAADVIVMTQACDLEQGKVSNVVLCPCRPISLIRQAWDLDLHRRGQNPTDRAWAKTCEQIKQGYIWSEAMIDGCRDAAIPEELHGDERIVHFSEIYTAPRRLIEAFVIFQGRPRLGLLPPYREHLSQSFARFFMRVGLPTPIKGSWATNK